MVDPSESKDEMDIEQIMRQLREKIRDSNPDAPEPFPEVSITPQSIPCAPVADPDLIYINQNYDTHFIVAPSVYRRLGRFVLEQVGFLRELYASKQVQRDPIVKQVQYNAAVVRLLNKMTGNMDLMNRRLERLEGALEESRRRADRLGSKIDPGEKAAKRPWKKK